MPLGNKPLDKIDETDLQTLVDNKVQESSTIDYKLTLPGNTDDEKKEFLADVSSFANSGGGHLIYGIRAISGVPDRIVGIQLANIDEEIQRRENLMRDGLEPPVSGISIRPVALAAGGAAIVLRIPKSWAAPHVVGLGGHWKRFYGRNSAGKYQLDISELRAAFVLSDTAGERIRSFRLNRVNSILSGMNPVQAPFDPGPRFILHLVPFSAVSLGVGLNLSELPNDSRDTIAGIDGYRVSRFNFDGFLIHNLMYDTRTKQSASNAYSQFFKNGSIETSKLFPLAQDRGPKTLNPTTFENHLLSEILPRLLAVQKRIGAAPPIAVMLTVLEVAGYRFWSQSPWGRTQPVPEIDRNVLSVPETLVGSFDEDPASFMRPIFDTVWNAAGWPRAMTYDSAGKWTPWPPNP